jgi:hypothetical protein
MRFGNYDKKYQELGIGNYDKKYQELGIGNLMLEAQYEKGYRVRDFGGKG